MTLQVSRSALTQMRELAAKAHPNECCGLMLGHGKRVEGLVPAANVHPSPQRHFEIDPQSLIDAHRNARDGSAKVVGYYHSHPDGPARPSSTDADMAHGDGMIWAIIGEGEALFWHDLADGFSPLSYQETEG